MIDIATAIAEIQTDPHPELVETPKGTWTPKKLRGFLDRNKITYRCTEKRNSALVRDENVQFDLLTACPLCGESEGHPAVWTHNGVPCFKCFYAGPGCNDPPKKTFADLLAHFAVPAPKIKMQHINAFDLLEDPDTAPKIILEGLLCDSDVAAIVGGPKTRKSFWVLQLALSIASGTPFLGLTTTPGRVRIYDNELRPNDLKRRLRKMMGAMNLDRSVSKQIEIVPLRGQLADLRSIENDCESSGHALIVIDALYKALPVGIDENSNSDMTRAFVVLDQIAEKTGCAVLVVHHTCKGSQAKKSVSDMGAGAGAQSRSADAHLVLREHEEEGVFVLQAALRNQKPFDPICVKFDYPLWQLAKDRDPRKIVADKKSKVTLEMFVEAIPKEPAPKEQIRAQTQTRLKLTKNQWLDLLRQAETSGQVKTEKPANRSHPHTIRRCGA